MRIILLALLISCFPACCIHIHKRLTPADCAGPEQARQAGSWGAAEDPHCMSVLTGQGVQTLANSRGREAPLGEPRDPPGSAARHWDCVRQGRQHRGTVLRKDPQLAAQGGGGGGWPSTRHVA